MADRKKKTDDSALTEYTEVTATGSATVSRDNKRMRKINPLGMRVVVRIETEGNQTEGGLYLPEGAKQNMSESITGEVIEVASASEEGSDEETNVSGVPLGARVLIPKLAGVKIPWDDQLRIVETKEILAIIHEVSLS